MKPAAAARRAVAFTLVELLVVIGIIAILIGILLPSLRRARESANKAACLSNLHQQALALQQYQNIFKGQLPIYVMGGTGYFNYVVYFGAYGAGTLNDYTGMGLMVAANVVKNTPGTQEGRMFYCPTFAGRYTQNEFNYRDPANAGASNPWVPEPGFTTRMTYSMRPEYWATDAATDGGPAQRPQFPFSRWDMDKTTSSANVFLITGDNKNPKPCFPRASLFNRKGASAIVMDLNSAEDNRIGVHRGGVNVLYSNWGAKYVPQEHIEKYLKNLRLLEANGGLNGRPARRLHFDMWQELDRY
jgi:type II secretory pathway pseudopilin PulG